MFFRNLLQSTEPSDVTNPAQWFVDIMGGNNVASSGEQVTAQSSLNVPTVFTCVNILSNSVANLPLQTFMKKRDGRIRDNKHPVSKLLEQRPNPYQNPFVFKRLMETHRNLWGNAYINVDWDERGYPKALWLLDPTVTEPMLDDNQRLWYVTQTPEGKYVQLAYDDVIHLTTLSLDGFKGKSPIQVAREAIGNAASAQKFQGKFFSNGATPSGILKTPDTKLGPEAKDKMREEWNKRQQGLDNAQRIAILDAGMEYQQIGMPLDDAQFIETQRFSKAEIANIFNLPLHMVNELERATHSNIEQQSLDFIRNTLAPIINQYEQEMTYKLFTERELKKYYLKFNLTSLLRGDSQARAAFYEKMINIGAMSINEVRALEEQDAIDHGDKHFISLNYTTIDLIEEYQRAKSGASQEGGEN